LQRGSHLLLSLVLAMKFAMVREGRTELAENSSTP
jgi:hypothetical protein